MRHHYRQNHHFELAVIQKEDFEAMMVQLIRETIRGEVQKIIEENQVRYLSVNEAPEMLGVSKETIHKYKTSGVLPLVRLGQGLETTFYECRRFLKVL